MKAAGRHEKSCGAVVYCLEGNGIRYLLVRSISGVWGFPKGHMEGNEKEHETALREIREETGLKVCFVDGFRLEDHYQLNKKNALKTVVYYLAFYENQKPQLPDHEIMELRAVDYKEAQELLQFDSLRTILREADAFIRKTGS